MFYDLISSLIGLCKVSLLLLNYFCKLTENVNIPVCGPSIHKPHQVLLKC